MKTECIDDLILITAPEDAKILPCYKARDRDDNIVFIQAYIATGIYDTKRKQEIYVGKIYWEGFKK